MKNFFKVFALAALFGFVTVNGFAATKDNFNRSTTTTQTKTPAAIDNKAAPTQNKAPATADKKAAALAYDKGYQAGKEAKNSTVNVPKEYAAYAADYKAGFKKGFEEKQNAELAYKKGYEDGTKATRATPASVPQAYSANAADYRSGYQKGYAEKQAAQAAQAAAQAAQAAAQTAYDKGYEDGTKATSATPASVPQAYSANAADYRSGYQKGYTEKKAAYDAGYAAGYAAGETQTSDVPSSIPGAYTKLASVYKIAYSSGWFTKRQETSIYNEGYSAGLRGISDTAVVPGDYSRVEWMATKYKEGFAAGLTDYLSSPEAQEAAKDAYEAGYAQGLQEGKNSYYNCSAPAIPNMYSPFKDKYTGGYTNGYNESQYGTGYSTGYGGGRLPRGVTISMNYTNGYGKGKQDKTDGVIASYPVNDNLVKYSSMVYVKAGKGTGVKTESGKDGLINYDYDIAPYYIGKYEVTQEFYEAILNRKNTVKMGRGTYELDSKPSSHLENSLVSGEVQGRRPVESITWFDAVYFCNALSELQELTPAYTITINAIENKHITDATVSWNKQANGYRLPSEEEWELACRGGDSTLVDFTFNFSGVSDPSFKFGDKTSKALDKVGWYSYNPTGVTQSTQGKKGDAGYCTHEVGKKAANRLAIFDMCGNVTEWVFDLGDDGERIIRGGSYASTAASSHVVSWNDEKPSKRMTGIGFRLVRNAE